jgi:hypothetical protein
LAVKKTQHNILVIQNLLARQPSQEGLKKVIHIVLCHRSQRTALADISVQLVLRVVINLVDVVIVLHKFHGETVKFAEGRLDTQTLEARVIDRDTDAGVVRRVDSHFMRL